MLHNGKKLVNKGEFEKVAEQMKLDHPELIEDGWVF
jgi:hypothetical protein